METFKILSTLIQEQIASALGQLAGSIALGIFIGLISGLCLIITARKKGWFKRDNIFWSFLARLNYIYIPVLFLALGGIFGTVRGVHNISGKFIDSTTSPIVAYAQGYLPQIQNFVNTQLNTEKGQNIQLEGLIASHLASEFGLDTGSYEYQAMFKINSTILSTVLLVKGPDCISTIRNMDITNMPPTVFNILPEMLHEVCDGFFFLKYTAVLVMFFPFLMIPVAEYIIFLIFGKSKMHVPNPRMTFSSSHSNIAQSEFV